MINGYTLIIGWRYAFSRRKTHLVSFLSFLSMLGIVMAVALLILVLSVMNGFDREMRERILGLVPHITLNFSVQPENWSTSMRIAEAHPEVVSSVQFLQFQGMLIRGEQAESVLVTGLAGLGTTANNEFTEYTSSEAMALVENSEDGMIMGAELAKKLGLSPGNRVNLMVPHPDRDGDYLLSSFSLSGLLASGTELDQNLAVVNFDRVQYRLPELTKGFGLRVQLNDIFQAERVAWELSQNFPGLSYASNWTHSYGNLYQAIQLSKNLVGILLFSIIAVAAFNVIASLVLVIIDKQGDISILRTLGVSPASINNIFLFQGIIIGVYGCVIGTAIGIGLSWIAADLMALIESAMDIQFLTSDVYPIDYLPVYIQLDNILMVNFVTIIMCVLAAIYPARKASRVAPADILRWE